MAVVQSLAEKVCNFIHNSDASENGVRDLIQKTFKIDLDDLDNLYALKYHLEKENDSKLDEAILFLNTIIDIYSKSAMYVVDQATKVEDLLSSGVTSSAKKVRLLKSLHYNSGIIGNGISEAVFKDGRLQVQSKQVAMQEDGSVYYLVTSNDELDRFENELFSRYSFYYSRVRSNDIKEKINALRSSNQFEGTNNEVLCVTNFKPDLIEFTLQGQDFCIVNDGSTIFQDFDLEDKGRYYRVWLI